jgi:hypothetical protein
MIVLISGMLAAVARNVALKTARLRHVSLAALQKAYTTAHLRGRGATSSGPTAEAPTTGAAPRPGEATLTRERARCHRAPCSAPNASTGIPRLPSIACSEQWLVNERGPGLIPHPPYPVRSGPALGSLDAIEACEHGCSQASHDAMGARPGCRRALRRRWTARALPALTRGEQERRWRRDDLGGATDTTPHSRKLRNVCVLLHSALAPANLITLAHFSVSAAMSRPKSAREFGNTV